MEKILLCLILGFISQIQGSNDVCGDIFTKNGYNISTFAVGVGHGLILWALKNLGSTLMRMPQRKPILYQNNCVIVSLMMKSMELWMSYPTLLNSLEVKKSMEGKGKNF